MVKRVSGRKGEAGEGIWHKERKKRKEIKRIEVITKKRDIRRKRKAKRKKLHRILFCLFKSTFGMREQQTYVINKKAILHVNRDESYMTDISRYLDCDR